MHLFVDPRLRDCYTGYLENLVSDGPSCVTMTCPSFKCPLKISTDTMRDICPAEVSEKYYKYVVRDFIDSSTYMHWCPAPNCGLIALGIEINDIVCGCSFPYCASCGHESHRPATCQELSQWVLKNSSESENSSWILVNTKGCPKCSRRIEKNKGCNHMTCSICRYEFCWICMCDWRNHNGNSYQCNQYQEETQEMSELRNVKQRLDRSVSLSFCLSLISSS
jgi:ariadne-1